MPRPPITPIKVVVTKDGPFSGTTTKTHPAFGMARFARISGSSGQLFGSEIEHQSFIRFTLGPGESQWSLHETRYHGPLNPRHVEIDFSAAQFAELITSMNIGSGVPCTIRVLDNQQIGGFEDADNLHEQIKEDLLADTKEIVDTARQLEKQLGTMLDDSKVPKAKQEALRALAAKIVRDLGSNMPFVLDQYQEAAEKVKAKCAAEVDALFTHAVQKLGLERLDQLNGGGEKAKELE